MNATRIIAVRHGETDWNVQACIQGQQDTLLNANGRWQAQRAAAALADDGQAIQAIYSSDLARALDTARCIADALALAVTTDIRLRERGFGAFEGRTFADIEREQPEQTARWRARDPAWAPPGGETLTELHRRVHDATFELAARHVGEQIVLVAHGGVLDMLYRIATHQAVDAPRTWDLGNTSINRLLWTPDGLVVVGWSDARHLEDDTRDEVTA